MSKEKSPEVHAEIDLSALMKLVKKGDCTIRVNGTKVVLALDTDLDDEDQVPLWRNISYDAEDKMTELEDLDEEDDDMEDVEAEGDNE